MVNNAGSVTLDDGESGQITGKRLKDGRWPPGVRAPRDLGLGKDGVCLCTQGFAARLVRVHQNGSSQAACVTFYPVKSAPAGRCTQMPVQIQKEVQGAPGSWQTFTEALYVTQLTEVADVHPIVRPTDAKCMKVNMVDEGTEVVLVRPASGIVGADW